MTDIVLDEIGSGYNLSKMNDNFQKIETSLNEDKLSTAGGNNTMQQALDMNNQRILNLGEPKSPTDPLRLGDVERINNTAVGANIVTQTAAEVPTTGVINGVKWYIIETAQTFVYVVENGETVGQWVEEDQVGDDVDILRYEGESPPSTGTWERTTVFWNSSPIVGEYVGWVCVTAGTPGIWKGFGKIEDGV